MNQKDLFGFSTTALLLLVVALSGTATANKEDDDLGFLPPDALDEDKKKDVEELVEGNQSRSYQWMFKNTLQASNKRNRENRLFMQPKKEDVDWSNLSQLDVQAGVNLTEKLEIKTNVVLNIYTRDNDSFYVSDDLRLDVKEAYLSYQKSPTLFFDVGRINLKSGVATGYNPTDYFKTGALLNRTTEDVSQLRNSRLGSLMLKGQKIWEGGSLTLAVSPEITDKENRWYSNKNIVGLNLNKSNRSDRFITKFTHEISSGFSPELIYFSDSGDHNIGLNISKTLNKQWFVYGEWNIGERQNILSDALSDAKNKGNFSSDISQQFDLDRRKRYLQQYAIGASFTSNNNITTKLEYHYNEAALSSNNAKKWFDLAEVNNDTTEQGQLLSVRGYAQARGESLSRHSLFFRMNWSDAGVDDLDLMGLLVADLNDRSKLMQVQATYAIDNNSEVALRFAKYQGNKKSVYGSLDQDYSVSLDYEYAF